MSAVAAERSPLTEVEWRSVLKGRRAVWLVTKDQRIWAYVRQDLTYCLRCVNAKGVSGDPRRGFCVTHRFMVSDAFPVLCRQHIPV